MEMYREIITHPAVAFFVVLLFLALGDVVATKTKALIPSIFIFVMLILIGVWTEVLPKEIIELAGFSSYFLDMVIVVIVVNMGSSLKIRDLKREWKTVVIGVSAIVGVGATVLTIGTALFGFEQSVVVAPPITGGFVAAFEMSKAALALGRQDLSTIALLTLALQSFPAYFLIPTLLKKEARTLLVGYRGGDRIVAGNEEVEVGKQLLPRIPEKYNTDNMILAKLGLLAAIGVVLSKFSGVLFGAAGISFSISPTIFALFLGVVGSEYGFLETQALQKANAFGLFMVGSIVTAVSGLVDSSPQEVFSAGAIIIAYLGIGIVGMGIFSSLAGKFLKVSWNMAFAIGLNCLVGFPLNYVLTGEAAKAEASNQEEYDYLVDKMSPTMLVGGFTTVTIGSVVFAGILKNFI
ncbi:hypothetical protein SAMN02745245_01282 [Anaerosphaera aminiphila DSM 21120]|uniref:Na+/glutamate symporter n=1 Tax=Anaerosphaera aminiphila DSM 21120 TaxID=1120995 RepID=A0A1M5SSS2_9FIRM|nr:hypothetical protein [Anaerosphaera aminiphila]SHH41594.1 hypothetical protein SAMN02745245_01282 [Anaerosphaera aminiphila DSM 21120]